MLESIKVCLLWVCPCFSNSTPHLHLSWIVEKWKVSGHAASTLKGVAPRICSKQHVVFLCSSHLAFSSYVLLASMWCTHMVVLTEPHLRRNPVLFSERDQHSKNWPCVTYYRCRGFDKYISWSVMLKKIDSFSKWQKEYINYYFFFFLK